MNRLDETYFDLNCPLDLALLADFHNSDPVPVLESLKNNKPDIITIAGDFVFGDRPRTGRLKIEENPNAVELLSGCSRIAPTFISPGNHEYTLIKADLKVIRRTGVTFLDNQWTEYKNTVIGGLSSAFFTAYKAFRANCPSKELYPKPDNTVRSRSIPPDMAWLDGFEQQPGYHILLCHHPEYYPKYLKNRKIDLILSGHCHGGQWQFYSPIHHRMRGVYAPGQGLFPELTSGVYDNRLVVSRGLANTTFVPRFNNPTEIIYIRKSSGK